MFAGRFFPKRFFPLRFFPQGPGAGPEGLRGIFLGAIQINRLYLGSVEIKKAYFGADLIFERT